MSAIRILVDADACPVKEEVYRVALSPRGAGARGQQQSICACPHHPLVERVLVSDKFDAADDWIAEQADAKTVVITSDILLADRCLKAGATVIGHNGKPFTTASSAAPSPRARSWPICVRAATSSAARPRSPRRTARGFLQALG